MALLFLYHNRQLLLLISTALLTVFAFANFANVNFVTNCQIVYALTRLDKCQQRGDLAKFFRYIPQRYRSQVRCYCNQTTPLAQSVCYKPCTKDILLVSLSILSTLLTIVVLVVSVLYANMVSKLYCITLLLATGCIFALAIFKNKLVDRFSRKLWDRFVLQVGAVFDSQLPFVVASSQQIDSLVRQIKLAQKGTDSQQEVKRLLSQTAQVGRRTVKQQRQINHALKGMIARLGE